MNLVYKLSFDYNFHLIKRDETVNMRIDFTNLVGYWDEVTDTPARKQRKRQAYQEHISNEEWRSKISQAKSKHERLRKRNLGTKVLKTTTNMGQHGNKLKRWFGAFLGWLGRLVSTYSSALTFLQYLTTHFDKRDRIRSQNTVESKNLGWLSMAVQQSILLFKAAFG